VATLPVDSLGLPLSRHRLGNLGFPRSLQQMLQKSIYAMEYALIGDLNSWARVDGIIAGVVQQTV
jgi:hypothetical protein